MAISLPKAPDGHQFEDYVAASLRALGYFVETRITLRENKKDILELDVVTTPSGSPLRIENCTKRRKPDRRLRRCFSYSDNAPTWELRVHVS